MIKLINAFTHTEMWVAENRKDEYITAGHKPADDVVEPDKPAEPKKRTTKKK